jgi:hypothetical protein
MYGRPSVVEELRGDHLDRHGPTELDIGGPVDDTHPAAAHHRLDAMAREVRAWCEVGHPVLKIVGASPVQWA